MRLCSPPTTLVSYFYCASCHSCTGLRLSTGIFLSFLWPYILPPSFWRVFRTSPSSLASACCASSRCVSSLRPHGFFLFVFLPQVILRAFPLNTRLFLFGSSSSSLSLANTILSPHLFATLLPLLFLFGFCGIVLLQFYLFLFLVALSIRLLGFGSVPLHPRLGPGHPAAGLCTISVVLWIHIVPTPLASGLSWLTIVILRCVNFLSYAHSSGAMPCSSLALQVAVH